MKTLLLALFALPTLLGAHIQGYFHPHMATDTLYLQQPAYNDPPRYATWEQWVGSTSVSMLEVPIDASSTKSLASGTLEVYIDKHCTIKLNDTSASSDDTYGYQIKCPIK